MKRIQTQEDLEKKRKRNTFILSILMLFILVSSTLGFAFLINPPDSNSNQPQPLPEDSSQQGTRVTYQGNSFALQTSREEIDKVPVMLNFTATDFANKILYLDVKDRLFLQEIGSTLGRISSRIQEACYGACELNLPEKNCTEQIIVWHDSEQNKVFQQDKCVFIEGDMKALDAFLYHVFT